MSLSILHLQPLVMSGKKRLKVKEIIISRKLVPLRSNFWRSFLASSAAALEVGVAGRSTTGTGEPSRFGVSFGFSLALSDLERKLWSVASLPLSDLSLSVLNLLGGASLSLSDRRFWPHLSFLSLLLVKSLFEGSINKSRSLSFSLAMLCAVSLLGRLSLGEVFGVAAFGITFLT